MSSTLNTKLTANGQPVPFGAFVRVAFNQDTDEQAYTQHYTDPAGTVAFEFTPEGPKRIYPHAQGFSSPPVDVVMPHDDQIVIEMTSTGEIPTQPTGPLSRLVRIDGHRMVNERGEKIYGRGASAFLLYKAFLDGDRVRVDAVLTQLEGLGCNLIRVMGMFESLGGFDPKAYPDYYEKIPAFCALCAEYGIYVLWTACAATGGILTTDDAVIAHIRQTVDQLLTTQNALCSPVNEQGQHNNSINLARVKAEINFGWLLHDMGSYGMDIPCSPPFGTNAVLHVNRRYSNSIRDCCILDNPNFVNDHLEVGLDEPARYGTTNDPGGDGNVQHAEDAAGTAYTALYFIVHTLEGERGNVLTGNTLDCAVKAFGAMAGR